MEVEIEENFDVMVKQFPSLLLLSIIKRIEKRNQLIPNKIESTQSKPWNANLSEAALEIKKAPQKLKLKYTPSSKTILIGLKMGLKEELWKNNNGGLKKQ